VNKLILGNELNIYIDADEIFSLGNLFDKHSNIHIHTLDLLPVESKDKLAIVITRRQGILDEIHADDFKLLFIIIPSEINLKGNCKLTSAIIYRCMEAEFYKNALCKILAGIIDFTFGFDFPLDAIDLKLALSFDSSRYIKIVHSTMDLDSLEKINLSDVRNDTSVVMNMKLNPLVLKKIEKVSDVLLKKLGSDYKGDCFFSAKTHESSSLEEVFVLYSV
jgi:hypothetical protein